MSVRSGAGPAGLLVAAPNWLGDLVMSTALIEACDRPEFGGVRGGGLAVSAATPWLPLLKDDPRIETLLPYDRGGAHGGLRGIARLAGQWRASRRGAVILLPPSLRAALVAALSGVPERIGFREDMRAALLTRGLKRPLRGDLHYVDELALLFAAWTGAPRPPAMPWPVLPGCAAIPPAHTGGEGVWALAIGATYGEAKSWPVEMQAAFVRAAVETRGARIVLLGDGKARAAADEIRERASVAEPGPGTDGPGLVDRVGGTGIPEAVSILKSARLFVGGDSGLMHLSAALGTPTVGLFGSTNPDWTRPRGPRVKVVRAPRYPCQPCYRRACDNDEFCLAKLEPETVLAAAGDLLDRGVSDAPGVYRAVSGDDAPRATIFVDRDGVLLRDPGYLDDPEAVEFLPGAVEALRAARDAGFRLVCLTNQSGIGRGYYSRATFETVQASVERRLSERGARLDGVYYCPHAPEEGCECRKPGTGMISAAARDTRWTPGAWMIGDKAADIEMGLRAGLRPLLVLTGEGRTERSKIPAGVPTADDLAGAIDGITKGRWS